MGGGGGGWGGERGAEPAAPGGRGGVGGACRPAAATVVCRCGRISAGVAKDKE